MDKIELAILRLYDQGIGIERTAKQLQISNSKVKKVLCNAGIAPTERAEQIQGMFRDGLSISEIAESLSIRESTVRNYLPYSRGPKNADYPTKNALRIRECRERKRLQADG